LRVEEDNAIAYPIERFSVRFFYLYRFFLHIPERKGHHIQIHLKKGTCGKESGRKGSGKGSGGKEGSEESSETCRKEEVIPAIFRPCP